MRKLASICNRLRRQYGVMFSVNSPSRGVYRVYLYSENLGDWFLLRSCNGVAETSDYMLRYELVKGGIR